MTTNRQVAVAAVLTLAAVALVVTGLVGDRQWLSLPALALLSPAAWLLRAATTPPPAPTERNQTGD